MGIAMEVEVPMENVYVTRREFEEYKERLADKKSAWDDGLAEVKAEVKELRELTASVSELAQGIKAMAKEQERMAKEQERQGERLKAIENRDGEMWRKLIGYVLTALASAVMTFIFTRLGR